MKMVWVFIHNLLRILRRWQHNLKPRMETCESAQVTYPGRLQISHLGLDIFASIMFLSSFSETNKFNKLKKSFSLIQYVIVRTYQRFFLTH